MSKSKQEKECIHCQRLINKTAKYCEYCQRSQSKFWSNIERWTNIAAILVVLFAGFQIFIAYTEMKLAKKAKSEAIELKNEFKRKLQVLSKELNHIKIRNKIMTLGDSTISDGGSVLAFDKLLYLVENSTDKLKRKYKN